MKQLTEEQLQDNWEKLLQLIEDMFEGERKTRLLEMYKDLEDRMVVAPASGKEEYHNCHVGGYVEHVLHVVDTARKMEKTYIDCGGFVDWTEEELVFSALHHDLGKVGDLEEEYYIPQDNDWRRKTLGEVYTHNTNIDNLRVPDRALWLLQYYGVKVSLIETLSIKLADGMYDEANPYYLKVFNADRSLKSHLPHIVHFADHMATLAEYDQWKLGEKKETKQINKKVVNIKKAVETEVKTKLSGDNAKDLFDELFGDKK
jgi:hypothetical protein